MLGEKVVKSVISIAKKKGLDSAEVYFTNSKYFILKVHGQQYEEFKVSHSVGAGIRVIIDGREGYAYTERLDDDAYARALDSAVESALSLCDDGTPAKIKRFANPKTEIDLGTYEINLGKVPEEFKIEKTMAIEKAALDFDKRITAVPMVRYSDGYHIERIANTLGMDKQYRSNYAMAMAYAVASEGDEKRSDGHYIVTHDFDRIDPVELGTTAARRALRKLGSREIPSGLYTVAFDNEVMCEILSGFASVFSARAAQEGKSLLDGKIGQKVANSKITIVDDALMRGAVASHPFDDEGHPTKKLKVIDRGKFVTFLHNMKTASKWGVKSTGHASRGSYKETLGVAPSNFYVLPGDIPFTEIVGKAPKVVQIADVAGLHSGINPITGDFSLSATGFLFKKGVMAHPVHNFTISGNFLDMLKNVTHIGQDLKFCFPSGISYFGSPTILVKKVSIGGA